MAPQRMSLERVESVFRHDRGQYYPEGKGRSALQYAAKALWQQTLATSRNPPKAVLAAVGQHGASMVEIRATDQKPGVGAPLHTATVGMLYTDSNEQATENGKSRDPRGAVEDMSVPARR